MKQIVNQVQLLDQIYNQTDNEFNKSTANLIKLVKLNMSRKEKTKLKRKQNV
jgi:hypothetical protein